jgi:hypothetical protein
MNSSIISLRHYELIKLRRTRWAGHAAYMWEKTNAYKNLVEKPEGRRSRGGPRSKWEMILKLMLGK